jgi:hypothetical protein
MADPEPIPLDYAIPTPGVPTALKIVAWIFIASGILTIIQTIVLLTENQIHFDTGVLGVFIGPGLLRFSRGWRTCALVLLWIGLVIGPIIMLMMLSAGGGSIVVSFFGMNFGSAPIPVGLMVGAFGYALIIWEYRVLVREDIRSRFGLPPR